MAVPDICHLHGAQPKPQLSNQIRFDFLKGMCQLLAILHVKLWRLQILGVVVGMQARSATQPSMHPQRLHSSHAISYSRQCLHCSLISGEHLHSSADSKLWDFGHLAHKNNQCTQGAKSRQQQPPCGLCPSHTVQAL
jgi:hypothetical protein